MFKNIICYLTIFSIFNCQTAHCGQGSSRARIVNEEDPLVNKRVSLKKSIQEDLGDHASTFQGTFDLEKGNSSQAESSDPENVRLGDPSPIDFTRDLEKDDSTAKYQEDNFRLNLKLIEWVDQDILNSPPPSKCRKYTILGVGIYSGASRGAVYFMLGYDLIGRAKLQGPGNIVLSTIYGTGVAAPMTILGLETSGDFINKLLKKKSIKEKGIELQRGKIIKGIEVGAKIILVITSLISASTITYLTYYECHNLISWFWLVPGVPNFYTRAAMDYDAIPIVSKTIYCEIRRPIDRCIGRNYPGSRNEALTFIKDKLEDARDYILAFNNEQADNFLTHFLNTDSVIGKIRMLLKPQLFEEVINVKKVNTWSRKLSGLAGGAIGVVGLWVYLPATKDGFKALLSNLFSSGEPWPQLIDGLTYTALLSASSIMSLASASSATKFFDSIVGLISKCKNRHIQEPTSFKKKCCTIQKKRAGAALIASILALWNASQTIEVALDFMNLNKISSQLALAASLFSFFSLSFWSVDEKLLKILKSSDPRTPILGKMETIDKKIYEMSDESLQSLRDFLSEQED